MSSLPNDTNVCPNCGHTNDGGLSACEACNVPLTAYGGQIRDYDPTAIAARRQEVARMKARPPAATATAAFDGLLALFWPIATVVGSFAARKGLNGDMTNYLGSALGVVMPVLQALVLLPIAGLLFFVAWGTLKQRQWAWPANLGVLGLFALMTLRKLSAAPLLSGVELLAAAVLLGLWFQPRTRAWYGR